MKREEEEEEEVRWEGSALPGLCWGTRPAFL